MLESALGFRALRQMHDTCVREPFDAVAISGRALDYVGVEAEFSEVDFDKLRSINGPLILAANHPFGGIEFLALVALMEKIRPGQWKFLANDLLCSIQGFEEKFIPLDPLARRPEARRRNRHGLKRAMEHLRGGGLLGLFPAGRVSYAAPELGGVVVDSNWS
ncbi:MAG: 1-acyl-sn-glycerol-3-phosphate acyltransferase, partial [Opitutales bacterium]|nr:1-acyl-sn-glycerol-3-phosphate acyltransferase [Opitutales bacterium]